MGSYEDYAHDSEQIEHILGLHEVDNYQIEVNNDTLFADIKNFIRDSESVLWADSRKCVQLRATEHNRSYGANARVTFLLVMEIPRSHTSTKIVKRRPGLAGKQLSISAGGEAEGTPTVAKKKRDSRLTET